MPSSHGLWTYTVPALLVTFPAMFELCAVICLYATVGTLCLIALILTLAVVYTLCVAVGKDEARGKRAGTHLKYLLAALADSVKSLGTLVGRLLRLPWV